MRRPESAGRGGECLGGQAGVGTAWKGWGLGMALVRRGSGNGLEVQAGVRRAWEGRQGWRWSGTKTAWARNKGVKWGNEVLADRLEHKHHMEIGSSSF